MAEKPNIVLIFTDDQRFDTIGALGNEAIRTPHMDRLAARGVSFDRAYIPGGTVDAVCMPSRAMLHTGRNLFRLKDHGETIPEEHVMLGEHLQRHGYYSYGIGKWHNARGSYARSFTDGDEIFFGGMDDHWNVPVYHFDPSGKYETTLPLTTKPRETNELIHRGCDHVPAGIHSSRLFADASIRFLDERASEAGSERASSAGGGEGTGTHAGRAAASGFDSEAPFFLYTAFMAPHDPRTMPRRFLDMYNPDEIELPENYSGGHPFDNGALFVRDELLAGFPRSPREIRRHIAEYYAMISHLDDEIGRILEAIENNGFGDNTIVILAGDNGLAIGHHGLMGKQNLYDHSTHVPLIVSGPGIEVGARAEEYVYLLDIFPSLCELLDIPIPDSVEGRSFMRSLTGHGESGRDVLYFAYGSSIRGLQDHRHKLIEYLAGGERTTQLFILEDDPLELHDLSGDPAYADQIRHMRQRLKEQAELCGDTEHPAGREFWYVVGREIENGG